jgi:hypothetical protein
MEHYPSLVRAKVEEIGGWELRREPCLEVKDQEAPISSYQWTRSKKNVLKVESSHRFRMCSKLYDCGNGERKDMLTKWKLTDLHIWNTILPC